MDTRKVIKFGSSSYVVTLPLEWIKKFSLEKDGEVNLIENEDCIVISQKKDEEVKTATLNIDNYDLKTFKRELISYYLKNYKYIKIEGKDLLEKIEDIKIFKEKLSSLEMIEIKNEYVLLKDLVNPADLKICELIFEIIQMEKILLELGILRNNHN